MDRAAVLHEVEGWPLDERLRLVDELWDRVIEAGAEPEMTQAQREELDRRLAALEARPDEVLTLGRGEGARETIPMSLPLVFRPEARDDMNEGTPGTSNSVPVWVKSSWRQ